MNNASPGLNKVHREIFDQQPHQERQKKGRSLKLILERNECLVDRYYFYGRVTGKGYELILQKLSTEFFLSSTTIADLLMDNLSTLSTLKKLYKEESQIKLKKAFETKWPHLSWEAFK